MPILVVAVLIGVIAGLRTFTAPAVVSWAARLGWINLFGTHVAFLGYPYTPWILSACALAEIINDKLPNTPSRKSPPQFIARIVMGAASGGTLGIVHNSLIAGLLAGGIGAVIGTLGGAAFRGVLARAFGKDLPAALLEDCVAVFGGFLVVSLAR